MRERDLIGDSDTGSPLESIRDAAQSPGMPVSSFHVRTEGRGLIDVTSKVAQLVHRAGVDDGLCTVFVRHTSASLVIQENADPTAARDLEAFLDRLVPDGDALYRHVAEGPDDMPSHVKAALTQTSIGIPITSGDLALGTWQGLYLWEHRRAPHRREVVVAIVRG
jgi:secondary thiamine-phosphate synthase enzyme